MSMAVSETRDFHPVVQDWLEDNGYDCEHEYTLPEYGRVDFFAIHKASGERFLIECKIDAGDITPGLFQVHSYRLQLPGVNAMLAIPPFAASEKHFELAQKYGIKIIEVDLPILNQDNFEEPPSSTLIEQASRRIEFLRKAIFDPEAMLNDVLAYHRHYQTSPVFDVLLLLMEVQGSNPEYYPDDAVKEAINQYLSVLAMWSRLEIGPRTPLDAIEIFKDTKRSFVLAKSSGGEVVFPADE
jgi:hypothetical protein